MPTRLFFLFGNWRNVKHYCILKECCRYFFQIVLTISQVIWCIEVNEVVCKKFDKSIPESLADFEKILFERLNGLAGLVRTQLPRLHRNIITALITVDVHARDIISNMVSWLSVASREFESSSRRKAKLFLIGGYTCTLPYEKTFFIFLRTVCWGGGIFQHHLLGMRQRETQCNFGIRASPKI